MHISGTIGASHLGIHHKISFLINLFHDFNSNCYQRRYYYVPHIHLLSDLKFIKNIFILSFFFIRNINYFTNGNGNNRNDFKNGYNIHF